MEKSQGSITIGLSEQAKADRDDGDAQPISVHPVSDVHELRHGVSDVRELRHHPLEAEVPTVRKPPPLDAIRRTRARSLEHADSLLEPESDALTPSIPKTIIGAPVPPALREDSTLPPRDAGSAARDAGPPRDAAPSRDVGPRAPRRISAELTRTAAFASPDSGASPPKRDATTLTSPVHTPLEPAPVSASSGAHGHFPRAPRPTVTLHEPARAEPVRIAPNAETTATAGKGAETDAGLAALSEAAQRPAASSSAAPNRATTSVGELGALRAQIERLGQQNERSGTVRLLSVTALAASLSLALGYFWGKSQTDGAQADTKEAATLSEAVAKLQTSAAATRSTEAFEVELAATKKQLTLVLEENATLTHKLSSLDKKDRSRKASAPKPPSAERQVETADAPPQGAPSSEADASPTADTANSNTALPSAETASPPTAAPSASPTASASQAP